MLSLLLACVEPLPADSGPREAPWEVPPETFVNDADRIVAIGDVHGDLSATRAALQLAGVIDDQDGWVGGETVVVQVGDQLDRGDDEEAILELLAALAPQAHAAGGAIYPLNGAARAASRTT